MWPGDGRGQVMGGDRVCDTTDEGRADCNHSEFEWSHMILMISLSTFTKNTSKSIISSVFVFEINLH